MQDYFREFLIPTTTKGLGTTAATPQGSATTEVSKTPMKTHILWAAGAAGVGLLAWKASKWHSIITSSTK